MLDRFQLLITIIVLTHHIQAIDDVLLFNQPSYRHPRMQYQILSSNNQRIKRESSPWFYPEFDKNLISCGPNVYKDLYTCSQSIDCK